MWARLQGAVRGAIWDVAWRLGTPAVSVPLVVLAAAQVGIVAALSSRAAAHAFATSWGSWVVAGALLVDSTVATTRAAPLVQAADGRLRGIRPDRRRLGALLVACGYLGIALGFTASLAARERLEFRCALAEPCSAAPEQIVSWDPMRPLSRGPFPMQFVIAAGEGGISRGRGTAPEWIEVRGPDDESARATRWRPLWFGWGRLVRPIGSGTVLRYELRGVHGEVLESAFAKLDVDPPGKVDSIRAETVPHRIYVRARPSGGTAGAAMPFEVAVYRGKLLMATATLAVGGSLPFEGLVLALPEWRPWVQLELVSDPGIPLALLGGILGAAGFALRGLARRRSRSDGAHGGGDSGEGRPT